MLISAPNESYSYCMHLVAQVRYVSVSQPKPKRRVASASYVRSEFTISMFGIHHPFGNANQFSTKMSLEASLSDWSS